MQVFCERYISIHLQTQSTLGSCAAYWSSYQGGHQETGGLQRVVRDSALQVGLFYQSSQSEGRGLKGPVKSSK